MPFVGPFRVEQHGRSRRTAATQEGRCPQRVTAVVAGPDDRADPPTGDPAGVGCNSRAIAVASP